MRWCLRFGRIGLVLTLLALASCPGDEPVGPGVDESGSHPLLGERAEAALEGGRGVGTTIPAALSERIATMTTAASGNPPAAKVAVDYPLEGSIFPPDFLAPTFLWHDGDPEADVWLIRISFSAEGAKPIDVLVRGDPPPEGEIDPAAIAETNALHQPTEYEKSARSYTPSDAVWGEIKIRSREAPATLTFHGFRSDDLTTPRSRGAVTLTTSKDPVGAPIFYRDVPLMPSIGAEGRIRPLGPKAIPLIAWRLRDVSRTDSKLVLKGMPSCGNCHSFSNDGKTLGMDVDGPDGDKGMYAIKEVSEKTVIDDADVITWNSFPHKPEGHRTIGFGSRVSPDGRYVATTVNEAVYVQNFVDHRFLQVFYPTRGILAYYSRDDAEMRAIPGADDPEYVHCSPVWSPDGKHIVFSRAKAFDPYRPGQQPAVRANDPREPQIRYDLYRMPFDGGKGGKPVPVVGASGNGKSNTFPKISPDGKWIVWTQCGNGLLMRPDSRLWIVPFEGGEPREMTCNTTLMNSWHSFSPNGRWLVFSSKSRSPYTQAFLTHIDENGMDSPAIHVPNCTAANRAVNLPEFMNAPYEALDRIEVPAVDHYGYLLAGERFALEGRHAEAVASLKKALEVEPTFVRSLVALGYNLIMLGRHASALPHLERAHALDPEDLTALLNMEVCYRRTMRPYMALAAIEKLLAIAPEFPNVAEDLALARAMAGKIEQETKRLEAQVKADPRNAPAHHALATRHWQAGRLEQARDHLEKAVLLAPTHHVPLTDLAWLLAANPDDGIRDGQRAVELADRAAKVTQSRQPEVLTVLAAALAEVGRHPEAVRVAEQALALARPISAPLAAELEDRLELHRQGKPIRAGADR